MPEREQGVSFQFQVGHTVRHPLVAVIDGSSVRELV